MIREPLEQPEEAKTDSPHNVARANIIQNRPITSEGDVTPRGTHKRVWPWAAFGSKRKDKSLWAFDVRIVRANAYVNLGYWRIDGKDEWLAGCSAGTVTPGTDDSIGFATLPLGGNPTYVCVKRPRAGGSADIVRFDGGRPPLTDGSSYFRPLCKCVLVSEGQYVITERYWRGDITESAPMVGPT
jgi:hypothetical protein